MKYICDREDHCAANIHIKDSGVEGSLGARRSASSILAAAAEVEDHLLDEHRDNGLPITGEWPSNRAAPDELIDSGDRELLYCRSPGSLACRIRDTASTMARSRLVTAFTLGALSLGLCTAALGQAIVVGSKGFTEQLLVAEMTVELLRVRGFNAHKGTGFATTGLRTLQEGGIIDLYWDYTGTSLTTFNHVTEKLSPDEGYERVKALDAQRGLVWLAPSKVNMRRADAAARRISSISDLAARVREGEGLKLASTLEFLNRTDG